MDGRANPLMDRKVVRVVFFGWLQWLQWSPRPQLLDVVWCSCSCSYSCGVVIGVAYCDVVQCAVVLCPVV